ncbi:MAG: amidohydrolase family protein [Desulfobacterales bacterium]|nr:amidohydrolase family protein [Desulfobacterales bacterium]
MSEVTDIAIINGTIVSGTGMTKGDVYIKNGVIEEVTADSCDRHATRTIDAAGKYILPGIIDAHLHPVYADRIDTISKAAAMAGITTLIPYIGAVKAWGETKGLIDAIDDFIAEGEKTSLVDFSIHCTLLQNDVKDAAASIPKLIEKGIISFKGFTAYKKRGMKLEDHELLDIMKIIAAHEGAIMAAHCENGDIIDYFEQKFIAEGHETPEYYPPSHPNLSESEAIYRFLTLGKVTGCPIYIPHVSAKESLAVIRQFKERGGEPEIYVETCPHYLTLTDDEMTKRGAIAKMSPPLRKRADIDALWEAVNEGLIDVIGSDAAGHTIEKNGPLWDNIFNAPNGIPGLDTLFQITYEEGVNKNIIKLPQLVAQVCENPAGIFGLFPKKGAVMPGADADMVVFDPEIIRTIPEKNEYLNVDYSMYEGRECKGAPVLVMQRGNILMENGVLKGEAGQGEFLPGNR